jgi:hypothetical protein
VPENGLAREFAKRGVNRKRKPLASQGKLGIHAWLVSPRIKPNPSIEARQIHAVEAVNNQTLGRWVVSQYLVAQPGRNTGGSQKSR